MTYKKRIVSVFPLQSQNCSSATTLLVVLLRVYAVFSNQRADCVYESVLRKIVQIVLVWFYPNKTTTVALGMSNIAPPLPQLLILEFNLISLFSLYAVTVAVMFGKVSIYRSLNFSPPPEPQPKRVVQKRWHY